jgi:hypothetical protein
MDQSIESGSGGQTAQGSTAKPTLQARSSPVGVAVVGLVVLVIVLVLGFVTFRIGL